MNKCDWNIENCINEALKYDYRSKFKKNSGAAYNYCEKNGLLDTVCSHMKSRYNLFTFDDCKNAALQYGSRSEFQKKCNNKYRLAHKNKWIDIICSHMKNSCEVPNKCIYVYEFTDNYAYVGLTNCLHRRNNERKRSDSDAVSNHINKTNLQPNLIQLTEYVYYKKAQELENYYLIKYKENGWNMLNIAKPGALGGNTIIWNKENCHIEALKYMTKMEFRNKSSSAYVISKNKKWLNDICGHMNKVKEDSGYWTKERCKQICDKYTKFSNFTKENGSCATIISRNKWQEELCSHMLDKKRKRNGYWNYNTCKEAISNCKTKKEFSEKYQGGYTYARKNKILDEISKYINNN